MFKTLARCRLSRTGSACSASAARRRLPPVPRPLSKSHSCGVSWHQLSTHKRWPIGLTAHAHVYIDPHVLMRAHRVDVAMFDDTMNLQLWPGAYTISVGGASNDTPLNTTVAL